MSGLFGVQGQRAEPPRGQPPPSWRSAPRSQSKRVRELGRALMVWQSECSPQMHKTRLEPASTPAAPSVESAKECESPARRGWKVRRLLSAVVCVPVWLLLVAVDAGRADHQSGAAVPVV